MSFCKRTSECSNEGCVTRTWTLGSEYSLRDQLPADPGGPQAQVGSHVVRLFAPKAPAWMNAEQIAEQRQLIKTALCVLLPVWEGPHAADALRMACDLIEQVLRPSGIKRSGRVTSCHLEVQSSAGLNNAEVPVQLRGILNGLGYRPSPSEVATIRDLTSPERLRLVIETAVSLSTGYAKFIAENDTSHLEVFPAQELFRLEFKKAQRDWAKLWETKGGHLFNGRMIALKNSPIWIRISSFALPFPPFDFHSGMWIMAIDRNQAGELGLLAGTQRYPIETFRLGPEFRQLLESRLNALIKETS